LRAWTVLCLSVFGQLACDQGESTFTLGLADAGTPSARHESACRAWAKTVCEYRHRCCEGDAGTPCPVFVTLRWINDEQCVSRTQVDCELAAEDSNVSFDDEKLASCTLPSDCSFGGHELGCLAPGKALAGAPCIRSESCQTGFCQSRYGATGGPLLCGTCQSIEIGCTPCGAKEACRSVDGGFACVQVAELGEPCMAGTECRSGYCQRAGGSQGVCHGGAGLGEACGETAFPSCSDFNTFCDGTGHCRAYLTAAYGETCGAPGELSSYRICTGAGTCAGPAYVCIPPAADGALCDEEQALGCLPPARCVDNHCVFPRVASCSR
jgi:hypothetical protein